MPLNGSNNGSEKGRIIAKMPTITTVDGVSSGHLLLCDSLMMKLMHAICNLFNYGPGPGGIQFCVVWSRPFPFC